jgi:hypothetical protein
MTEKYERQLARSLARRFPSPANEDAARAVVDDMRAWLRKQPPDLVGATEAAKILGVQTPHVTRLREQGRMPEGVPVAGSVQAYVREEVEALARELEARRKERAARRAEKTV